MEFMGRVRRVRSKRNDEYDEKGRPRLRPKSLVSCIIVSLKDEYTKQVEFDLGAHRRMGWLRK